MIRQLNLRDDQMVQHILDIQMPAYKIEAALIGYDDIPPLKDTIVSVKGSGELFYGYFEGEKLLGVISYKIEDRVMDICRLVVHPDYFRRGVAKKLLLYVENSVEEIQKIKVATGSKNIPAVKLYKSLGFEEYQVVILKDGLQMTEFEKIIIKKLDEAMKRPH